MRTYCTSVKEDSVTKTISFFNRETYYFHTNTTSIYLTDIKVFQGEEGNFSVQKKNVYYFIIFDDLFICLHNQ